MIHNDGLVKTVEKMQLVRTSFSSKRAGRFFSMRSESNSIYLTQNDILRLRIST